MGGRWPRPRPRADEGKASAICPVTGCNGKAAPHQPPVGGSFPPKGEALGNPPHLRLLLLVVLVVRLVLLCWVRFVVFWVLSLVRLVELFV